MNHHDNNNNNNASSSIVKIPDDIPQTFVTHLECSQTGERYTANMVHTLSRVGKPLLVRYDLQALQQAVTKNDLKRRSQQTLWRYREFLPVRNVENCISLGEVVTPLLRLSNRMLEQQRLGVCGVCCGPVYVKDEGRLPTGSFKARGLCLAVSMARELGIQKLAIPTNGNAGAAMAAYVARAAGAGAGAAGNHHTTMQSYVFCPHDTPETNLREIAMYTDKVYRVKGGLIHDCAKIVRDGVDTMGWFDLSTLKEPYRIEGKKTMGLELAEQLDWNLPDVIIYPTGGGTGLIGMIKAFDELEAIGWIDKKKRRPRMVAVQASGCAPIVHAWEQGLDHAEFWPNAAPTIAAGIRVPVAVGDFLILQGIRSTHGFATAVDDADMAVARAEMAKEEGILLCPEGAATFAAYKKELQSGRIAKTESVVLFNCATGLKYDMPPLTTPSLDIDTPIDYASLL
jgi:threonine synthase